MPLEPATKPSAPKVIANHDDLTTIRAQHRRTRGTTVRDRKSSERKPIKSTDRRRSKGVEPRNIQFNTNVTETVQAIWQRAIARHDLTKAEFTERAIRHFAEHLDRGGDAQPDGSA